MFFVKDADFGLKMTFVKPIFADVIYVEKIEIEY
jgi:hypothetical protein